MEMQTHPKPFYHRAEPIVSMAAKALNEAGIPCVLWGDCSTCLWGTDLDRYTIDFVVPDEMADKAIQTLLDTRRFPLTVSPCIHPSKCELWANSGDRFPSKRHLHWSLWTDDICSFQIFSRSELLSVPAMDALPSEYADNSAYAKAIAPHYLLASDTSLLPRGEPKWYTGAYEDGLHPVVAPMPHVVIETGMRLYARYIQRDWTNQWDSEQDVFGAERQRQALKTKLFSDPVLRRLFIRRRDQTFGKGSPGYRRLLTEHLGEKPYVAPVVPWRLPEEQRLVPAKKRDSEEIS